MIDYNDVRIHSYFKLHELECPCCHMVQLHSLFIKKLFRLREWVGLPFIITSGYRCIKHNKEVGGVSNSLHTFGAAVDIKNTFLDSVEIVKFINKLSFGEVIVNKDKGYIHIGY